MVVLGTRGGLSPIRVHERVYCSIMVLTAGEIAAAVRAGEVDPVQVTQAALDRIAAADGVVGAFRHVRKTEALAEAAEVAKRSDLAELPLAGVPVAVKDVTEVAGEFASHGSAAAPQQPFFEDGLIARRLRDAGAVIVGLTRVPEMCLWPMSDTPDGIARNPWEPTYTAGGSSGGSAAAVAAGLVPVAHGTDGLGSIRLPSAMCGLVGLTPGTGVVGESSWFGLSEHGPLATTVADAALLMSVLAGRPALAEVKWPSKLRIGFSTQVPVTRTPLPKELGAAVDRARELLAAAGHETTEAAPAYSLNAAAGILARWFSAPVEDADRFGTARLQRRTRGHVRLGRFMQRAGLVRETTRDAWRSRTAKFFESPDVLMTPTLSTWPAKAGRWHERRWLSNVLPAVRIGAFTSPWNLAGYPALSVPIGPHPGTGLPTCVQLVAAPGGESTLLGLAAQLEDANPWPRTATADR